MKLIDTLDVKMAGIRDELKEIEAMDDHDAQGYAAAPLICQMAECSPKQLFFSVVINPALEGANALRDHGMLRWCRDQLAKQPQGDGIDHSWCDGVED